MRGLLPLAGYVAAAGLLVAGIAKAIDEIIEDDYRTDEDDAKAVLQKMKKLQNELARLSDIKELNDRRESTGQVNKTSIQVEGVEINELIVTLTEELDRLTKKYQKLNSKDGGKKRKKRNQ
jgi:lysyl-tRNA synthetase class II